MPVYVNQLFFLPLWTVFIVGQVDLKEGQVNCLRASGSEMYLLAPEDTHIENDVAKNI